MKPLFFPHFENERKRHLFSPHFHFQLSDMLFFSTSPGHLPHHLEMWMFRCHRCGMSSPFFLSLQRMSIPSPYPSVSWTKATTARMKDMSARRMWGRERDRKSNHEKELKLIVRRILFSWMPPSSSFHVSCFSFHACFPLLPLHLFLSCLALKEPSFYVSSHVP